MKRLTKELILKTLARLEGIPLRQDILESACRDGLRPKPLLSDIHEAIEELEREGFISGAMDPLDKMLATWALTEKGKHQAKQL